MSSPAYRVGELAERTGLTVRTLHHYDEIGLLSPARRTAAGHRIYETPEIVRLHQIRGLQQLGFPLDEIAIMLQQADYSPRRVIELQLRKLRRRVEQTARLCKRLEAVADKLQSSDDVSAEEFIKTIEAMTIFEKYYTPEQMQYLKKRGDAVGEERMKEVQQEWQDLYAEARAQLERGTDPASAEAQALVRKQQALIEEFTGGDAGIRDSLSNMYRNEPSAREQWGPGEEVGGYLRQASEAAGKR